MIGRQAYPHVIVVSFLLLAGVSLWYAAGRLGIQTDTTQLINPKLAWRQDFTQLKQSFPDEFDNILIFIQGPTQAAVAQASTQLTYALKQADTIERARITGWHGLSLATNTTPWRLLTVTPVLDYQQMFPGHAAKSDILQLCQQLGLVASAGFKVQLTGDVILMDEELASVHAGAWRAMVCSGLGVLFILWFTLSDVKLTLLAMLTIGVGLCLTCGFAAIAIGHLNMISVAFAVLYVGLGVDFSIHFLCQYKTLADLSVPQAVAACLRKKVKPLCYCALTTSIGFFAFLPTDYTGVSELGLIAGVGMLISLVVNLGFLPACLSLTGPLKSSRFYPIPRGTQVLLTPLKAPRWVLGGIVGICCAGIVCLPQLDFDANPMQLRDPRQPSMQVYRNLVQLGVPLYSVTVVATTPTQAHTLGVQLAKLKSVAQVLTADRLAQQLGVPIQSEDWQHEGKYKLQVLPKPAYQTGAALDAFIEEVLAAVPHATGLPVVNYAAAKTIVGAFAQALSLALILISLLLCVLLRAVKPVLGVLLPLAFCALGGAAVCVLFAQPLNFANIIALPLLMGLGVDNGIHWMTAELDTAMPTSQLLRATIGSTLTTICSFGNLAFSPHLGMSSMGQLLTLGMILILFGSCYGVPAWKHSVGKP